MNSLVVASVTFGCMLAGMAFGLLIRKRVPEHHTKDASKDIMEIAAGMMATLSALIIGLLVSSAKSSADATSAALTQSGAKIITLDHLLVRFGPETSALRQRFAQVVAAAIERIWPGESSRKVDLAGIDRAAGLEDVYFKILDLVPKTDDQRHLKSTALQIAFELMESRWMLIEQSQTDLPDAFLLVMIFWLTLLFTGLGLLAPRNLTVFMGLFLCAVSMASAVFLILELNRPLEGAIKVSSAPLKKALEIISR